eukprot:m.124955 g.124955  ORF g.124955 m.124955 type:complete len:123 (-) comp13789_c0_seq2:620-988(-)
MIVITVVKHAAHCCASQGSQSEDTRAKFTRHTLRSVVQAFRLCRMQVILQKEKRKNSYLRSIGYEPSLLGGRSFGSWADETRRCGFHALVGYLLSHVHADWNTRTSYDSQTQTDRGHHEAHE